MKNMFKLGIVLALYATAACIGLAFVYSGTQKTIAERQQADLEAALKELFPQGDSFEDITGTIESPDSSVAFSSQYAALRGGEVIGAAIQASGPSYGGPIVVLVGVGTDGKISGAKILDNQDTPGLGANASSATYYVDRANKITFYSQFAGKSISDPFEPKNDVAAITASTITSRAVASVVKASGSAGSVWLSTQTGGVR
ncbi:FMN-binding protein [Breznakiella homolactica]|uniref:Ion-translocating oxidoreductase complex subunit G n=1 Tax=Breznakiella homolactica TaxID=2798577 RepID=A0A7T7XP38_9SPIR|nr:FMN-binding protein [Breznakiella homolactica]QQO09852.1 FMN-binding protein [Breznakiella homolactica]